MSNAVRAPAAPMRCPSCKNKVLSKSDDGLTLRPHGSVTFADGACHLRCYFCKSEIELSYDLVKTAEKMSDHSASPRMVIRPHTATK